MLCKTCAVVKQIQSNPWYQCQMTFPVSNFEGRITLGPLLTHNKLESSQTPRCVRSAIPPCFGVAEAWNEFVNQPELNSNAS